MSEPSSNGWPESAQAWIADMGEHGDWTRRHVLDGVMLKRALGAGPNDALDVGCGEGRFCRRLRERGVRVVGVDPTPALLDHARARDPEGDYRPGVAEALPFPDASFDLVITYLTLVDIADYRTAIGEMARVLRPGGALLVGNLTSVATARVRNLEADDGTMTIDNYLDECATWESWRGINIVNWHRPLSAYLQAFIAQGLVLSYFDEPPAVNVEPEIAARYRRAPWFLVMEWKKPNGAGV